ncbi:MAG: Flp pilus assembly complex ATPase component TadA, partial [Peptococcaceae bacterium]|nr:Flp pilus assembly complex ATPase component TadA [Peptococcaceae bacterium]
NKKSLISQREVSLDSQSYVTALYACLRQSPDVILLGEMRDLATIQTALTAAETGHLVISTLHTLGAANSIDRVSDVFPPAQQQQIRIQLSMLLVSVISQQLVPTVDGGLAPAFEIMHVNNAIKNMIREAKVHQLDSVISSSAGEGMISMDNSLLNLYKSGKITKENAVSRALNPDIMQKRIGAMAS